MRTINQKIKIVSKAHHRNGVGGRPFNVYLLDDNINGRMVAIIPANAKAGECYALNVEMLAAGNIEFGQNSWRGDDYQHMIAEIEGGEE